MIRLAGTLWTLLFAAPLLAQQPLVRVKLNPDEAALVGQQLSLSVSLLAPGYFASAASFDLPDPDGMLLMPPEAHPVVGNETIEGVMYTSQMHELRAWAMRAGEQQIPALTIRFAYRSSPLDSEAIAAEVRSQAIPLNVGQPPGTEGMGVVISARELEVSEQWEPEPGGAPVEAGAAFTRTITLRAADVPGMIFPAFPTAQIEGLGIYSKPRVNDHNDQRGGFTGERQQVITYVAKRPGEYLIPAAEFRWYDLDAGEVVTEHFAARTLEVLANPAMASGGLAGQTPFGPAAVDWARMTYLALGLLVLLRLSLSAPVQAIIARGVARLRPRHLLPLHPGPSRQDQAGGLSPGPSSPKSV